MRRDSQLAGRISRALVRRGLDVSTRRLERWCAHDLGASEYLFFEAQVAHYVELARISRSGQDVDVAARRLASRGYGCERLRPSILRSLGISPTDTSMPALDLSTGPSGDVPFAMVEQLAQFLTATTNGLPSLMVKIDHALRTNAARYSEKLGESGEDIHHSFFVSGLCHLMGGDFYNGRALAAVFNVNPDEIDDEAMDYMNGELRLVPSEIDETYRSASIEDIVVVAQRLNEFAPSALEHIGVTDASEAEIEDLVAMFAPAAVYFVKLLQTKFEDFPQLLLSA
jgi:hypothetical protein